MKYKSDLTAEQLADKLANIVLDYEPGIAMQAIVDMLQLQLSRIKPEYKHELALAIIQDVTKCFDLSNIKE